MKNQDRIFNFRFNDTIDAALEKLAEEHGLNKSSYLRMMILREAKQL
jgi:predicted DNA-binding protein